MAKVKLSKQVLEKIESLLAGIDPEVDFDMFHEIMGLVYVETFGSYHGLTLLDEWYSQASNYPGSEAVSNMWYDYLEDDARYFGMAKLMSFVPQDQQVPANTKPPITRPTARYRLH
jgi:hypothetical protein